MLKRIFKFLFFLLVFLIPLIFTTSTFNVTRIKITLFEFVLPWVFLLYLYINGKSKSLSFVSLPKTLIIFTALFFLSGIFFYLRSNFSAVSFEVLLLEMLFFAFLLISLERAIPTEGMHKTIFFTSIFVFLYGLLQIWGFSFLHCGNEFLLNKRIFSTLANPNDLAMYANVVFFLGLYYFLEKKNRCALFFILFSFVSLILTKSGSGILGFLFGFILLSLSGKKQIRVLSFYLFMIISLAAILSVIFLKSDVFLYRVYLWRDVVNIIKERPFLGWGLDSFRYIYPNFRNPYLFILLKDHQIEFLHPESFFLDLLIQGGVVYLSLFLIFNISVFYFLFKSRQRRVCFYYSAIIAAFLSQNICSDTFYSFTPYFLYILILGLSMREISSFYMREETVLIKEVIFRVFFVFLLVINIFIMSVSWKVFKSDFYIRKAIVQAQRKNHPLAEDYFYKSIECNYFNVLAHYLIANAYLEEETEDGLYQALMYYNNVENLAGNYLQTYFFKAIVYARFNDHIRADYYFRKAFKNDPYLYYQFKDFIELGD